MLKKRTVRGQKELEDGVKKISRSMGTHGERSPRVRWE